MPQVYEKGTPEYEFVSASLRAGVSPTRVEMILVLAKLTDKKPLEIQSMWMDAHIGLLQINREIPNSFVEGL
jgi:hypothetical protein